MHVFILAKVESALLSVLCRALVLLAVHRFLGQFSNTWFRNR